MEWRTELPKPQEEKLYLVAVETTDGRKVVATATVSYWKNKHYVDIQHSEIAVHQGKVVAWAEMPEYPAEVVHA